MVDQDLDVIPVPPRLGECPVEPLVEGGNEVGPLGDAKGPSLGRPPPKLRGGAETGGEHPPAGRDEKSAARCDSG